MTAFQPALTRRTALKTAPPPAFSASATRRRPCLAVSAGGASPGGRLAALLRALRSAGTVSRLFFGAARAEIGGGWLVWSRARGRAALPWAACGAPRAGGLRRSSLLLPPPIDDWRWGRAARGYAVVRPRIFIGMSFCLGLGSSAHGPRPLHVIGSAVALIGVAIVLLWPRISSSVCAAVVNRGTLL